MKICIDAGHGGRDPGAVNGKWKEADIALQIALRLGSLLEKNGNEVVYTRKNDTFIELYDRCKIANNAGSDCFVSIHLNSADNKQAHGTETLVYGPSSERACKLAEIVNRNIVSSTKFRDRGVKYRPELCVLRRTIMPAILVETGFISNDEELESLLSDFVQELIVVAISDGIKEWSK